jgi:hypothetical protein
VRYWEFLKKHGKREKKKKSELKSRYFSQHKCQARGRPKNLRLKKNSGKKKKNQKGKNKIAPDVISGKIGGRGGLLLFGTKDKGRSKYDVSCNGGIILDVNTIERCSRVSKLRERRRKRKEKSVDERRRKTGRRKRGGEKRTGKKNPYC